MSRTKPPTYLQWLIATLAVALGVTALQIGGDQFGAALLTQPSPRYPLLAACGEKGFEVFIDDGAQERIRQGPDDAIDVWSRQFRQDVTAVFEALADPAQNEPECTGESGTQPLPPRLRLMAEKLPAWSEEADLENLERHDIGVVLQEYLRVYECALEERRFFLFPAVLREITLQRSTNGLLDVGDLISLGEVTLREAPEQNRKIEQELLVARKIINRGAALALGMDRFSGLGKEVTCLQRASLDLRNGAALAAEAAAQLPRILDAKDPLRDFNEP